MASFVYGCVGCIGIFGPAHANQLDACFASEIHNICEHLAKTVGCLNVFLRIADNVALTH